MNVRRRFCAIAILLTIGVTYSAVQSGTIEHQRNEVLQRVKNDQIPYVDFLFTDILGNLRSVTIPSYNLASALTDGIKCDGSSIPGFSSIYESDMHIQPDLSTFSIVGSSECPSASIICCVQRSEDQGYEADARTLLKAQLDRAHQLGFEFFVGPELEFFLTRNNDQEVVPVDNGGYFSTSPLHYQSIETKEILQFLLDQGIRVEKLHHEVAPGQYEVSLPYSNALNMADTIVRTKQAIKRYADRYGMRATFMPKPIEGKNGSGMHIHFSLYNLIERSNAFYDAYDDNKLSPLAKQFIAGVLDHIPAMTAFLNPTVNSYKRLVAGFEAPVYICWATKNRSALIRIPQINHNQACAARAEIRSPDAMTNPYLAFAVLLAAGLDGIERELALDGQLEENVYRLSPNEILKKGIATLPASLDEALDNLDQDALMGQALSSRLIDEFITLKKKELRAYRQAISPWEIAHYF